MAECPYCHITIENSHKFCRSCGANLLLPEFDRAFCPHCGARVGTRQWFCQQCESPLEKEAEGSSGVPPAQSAPVTKPKKRNPWVLRILAGVGLMILVLVGAFLWRTPQSPLSIHPPDIAEEKAGIVANRPEPAPVTALPSPQTLEPAKTGEPGSHTLLRQQLVDVANNLREAQLNKDISKYMQSYVSSFPNLKQKRQKTLAVWKIYDYKALTYDIKDIALLDNDTAVAQVSWNIEAHNKVNHQRVRSTQVYKVWFSHEPDGWRVKNLKAIPKP